MWTPRGWISVIYPIGRLARAVCRRLWVRRRYRGRSRCAPHRLPAALAYVRENGLDRVAFGAARPRFAIVTTGKAYLDLLDALAAAGLNSENAARIGLGVYKVAMPWPLEPSGLRAFARGAERLLVVEHKRALMEPQIRDQLYDLPEGARPIVEGKRDQEGKPFLSDRLALGFEDIVAALARWLPEGEHRARAASRVAERREAGPADRRGDRRASAHPLLLRRLSAQPVHGGSRRKPRPGRDRLSHHGPFRGPRYAYLLPDGRGGRPLDRAGAVHG